jgi:hypothetical protein
MVGQQRDLDPAAQTAQAQCDYYFQSLSRARPLDIQTLRPVFGNLKTGRVSDAATAVAATRNSECCDRDPKPSEVEIRYLPMGAAHEKFATCP